MLSMTRFLTRRITKTNTRISLEFEVKYIVKRATPFRWHQKWNWYSLDEIPKTFVVILKRLCDFVERVAQCLTGSGGSWTKGGHLLSVAYVYVNLDGSSRRFRSFSILDMSSGSSTQQPPTPPIIPTRDGSLQGDTQLCVAYYCLLLVQ